MQLFISPAKKDIKSAKTELERRGLFDRHTGVISQAGQMFVATTVTDDVDETGSDSSDFVQTTTPSIQVAVQCSYYLRAIPQNEAGQDATSVPKRYTIYGSMALFTAGSFDGWESAEIEKSLRLWLKDKPTVTHVAVNSPISKQQNVIRHPGITRLLGDWGPDPVDNVQLYNNPSEDDFRNAYWTTTMQNNIKQSWAPMYTMFSRGNIKEKARVLNSPNFASAANSLVIDLYCGIGYFFLSYAKLRPRVLLGWDINAWSIEGLRRGAALGKLSLQVVKNGQEPDWSRIGPEGTTHAIVFNESNEKAVQRIAEMRNQRPDVNVPITHINMGLLPDCKQAWETATSLALPHVTTYHVHENVAMNDIDTFTTERAKTFGKHLHTEMVKTFAPGVGHIVWDFLDGHQR